MLRENWLTVIEQLGAGNLVIGDKSLSGRTASMVADEANGAGFVFLGYPPRWSALSVLLAAALPG